MYTPYKSYKVKRSDRAATEVNVGDIVYTYRGHDYGCSRDDTMFNGIDYISLTKNSDNSGPFFTIPVADLEELK